MTAPTRIALTTLTASALLALVGCTAQPAPEPAPSTPDSASGIQPSDQPEEEFTPEELNARSIASTLATASREWLTAWDDAGCTGETAAEDVSECQIMLTDLATGADAVADLLEEQATTYEPLLGPAERARLTSTAADEWLSAWCGAYADPDCAAPGIALVDAYRDLDAALDLWYPRGTPDA